jgi:hypothetical protein
MKKLKLNYSKFTPLPNSFLAEQAILNILLTNPNLVKHNLSGLKVNSFFTQAGISPIVTLNGKENSTIDSENVSNLFDSLAIPSMFLYYKIKHSDADADWNGDFEKNMEYVDDDYDDDEYYSDIDTEVADYNR